jgi:uncharacterized protein (TIGR03435 family)
MRAAWRNVLASGRVRVALSAAVTMGMAISGSMAPRRIAYAQAGTAFEVSPAIAVGRGGGLARMTVSRTPERIAFDATLVGNIMAFAYGLPLDRVERRPQWMYDDRYDVAVTTAAPASLPEQKLMLQKLLEERFGLVVHRVSNPSPVYYLVRGSKVNLTATQEGDSEDIPELRCSRPFQPDSSGRPTWGACILGHASMSDLTAWLYSPVGLPVLDKTGITGLFDIEMPALPRGGAEGTIRAVRDALGLDLQVQRGTAESLIIDHVEKPN